MASLSPDPGSCFPPAEPFADLRIGKGPYGRDLAARTEFVHLVVPRSFYSDRTGIIKAYALSPMSEPLIEYSLRTDLLPVATRECLLERLSPRSGPDSVHLLRSLYEVTPNSWQGTCVTSQFGDSRPTHRMELVVPSLAEYLEKPARVGTEYTSEILVGDRRVRLDAHINLAYDSVDLTLNSTNQNSTNRVEKYQIKGSAAPDAPLRTRLSDLRVAAWKAMEALWDYGPAGFRQHVLVCAWRSEPQAPLSSGATIMLRLGDRSSSISVASSALTPQARKDRSISVCRWSFRSGGHPQDLHLQLAQTAHRLQAASSTHAVSDELALLSERSDLKAIISRAASPIKVLGPELVETLSALPGIHLSPVPIVSVAHQAEVLRGIRRVGLSLHPIESLKHSPQILNQMDLAFHPQGDISVRLRNEINHCIEARVTPQSRLNPITGEDFILTLGTLFASQPGERPPWQSRVAILEALNNLRVRDPARSSLIQVGDSRLPHYEDHETHRLIDTLAVPYIMWLHRDSSTPATTSHVSSFGPRQLQLVLSKPDYRFELSLQFTSSRLRRIEIRPRQPSNEHSALFPSLGSSCGYLCNIPVADVDVHGESIAILNELTRHFCKLSRERTKGETSPSFEGSELQQFLRRISQPDGGSLRN